MFEKKGKAGAVRESERLFQSINHADVVVYNAMSIDSINIDKKKKTNVD